MISRHGMPFIVWLRLLQLSAQRMVARGGGGSIVIIGSIMADMATKTASAYSMAKCAVNPFSSDPSHQTLWRFLLE